MTRSATNSEIISIINERVAVNTFRINNIITTPRIPRKRNTAPRASGPRYGRSNLLQGIRWTETEEERIRDTRQGEKTEKQRRKDTEVDSHGRSPPRPLETLHSHSTRHLDIRRDIRYEQTITQGFHPTHRSHRHTHNLKEGLCIRFQGCNRETVATWLTARFNID